MKILSLFSGIGAFEKALKNNGVNVELVNYCELDKYASKAYSLIHNVSEGLNLKDVTKVDTTKLPDDLDLITYGFPCVPAGYLIKTKNGYKTIEDVTTNDYVLTHTNTYQKVVKTMNRISTHINNVKGVGCIDLQVTDEHPVYVLRNNDFMWIKAKDLLLSDRLVFNKNTKSENTDIPDNVLWLMGRYFADGYKENHALHRVIFCIGKKKTSEFEDKIQGINFVKHHENRSCIEYKFMDNEVLKYFTDFKTGSLVKDIPQWIIDLSKDKLIHFYNGYYSGDGHNRKDRDLSMFCTVSKKMAYELQDIVIKLFNVVPSLNIRKDKRSKTFNDSYCFQFSLRPKEQIIRDEKICVRIKNLYREEKQLKVFNFEVENDNSYTVNNVIVHNCQDISIAGKQKGFTNENGELTRSGLFFEALRIISETKPKIAIAENVKALTSKKFEKEFNIVLDSLNLVGYNNYYKVLNAKDYGIPQNRERVFIVSIRKDIDNGKFTFPQPFKLELRLKDMLEVEVDEKYYLSKEVQERFTMTDPTFEKNIIGTTKPACRTIGQRDLVYQENSIMGALVATDYKQPKQILQVAQIYPNNGNPQAGRVYSSDGLSPTLDSMRGGNRQPKIIDAIYNHREPRVYSETAPTLRSERFGLLVSEVFKIRKLTPRECWRLMGFDDTDIQKCINAGISDSQLYKMAGNSIVVNVLSAIFKTLED